MSFFAPTRLLKVGTSLGLTLLIATAAAPVQAAGSNPPPVAEVSQEAQSERPICKRVATPGSRVSRRECRTRAEWDRESQPSGIEEDRPVAPRSDY